MAVVLKSVTEIPASVELIVSVVLPCLNEAQTLEFCIAEARAALAEAGIHGEVIVADNGRTDGSPQIARQHGARVVDGLQKSYGAAQLGGGLRRLGVNLL